MSLSLFHVDQFRLPTHDNVKSVALLFLVTHMVEVDVDVPM
jgi:hypothetical protein